jgi:ribose/xylose/arabinose/galactoside ABC-type transport system permease subunit
MSNAGPQLEERPQLAERPKAQARPGIGSRILQSRAFWPLAGLGLLLAYCVFFDPDFFKFDLRDGNLSGPIVSIVRFAVMVMFIAIGMTLVISTGGVDLSVGSVMAVVGALVATLAVKYQLSGPVLLGVAAGAALVIGLFNGTLISYAGVQPIIATLIMMVLGRGVALAITGGIPLMVKDPLVLFMGKGHFLGLPVQIVLVLVFFALASLACRKTAAGLFIESVGDNETASRLSGINARGIKLLVYVFSALCAAVAALVYIGDVGRVEPDQLGLLLELDAITAVVVGGTVLTGGRFTLLGSLIGALLIQTLTTVLIRAGMPSDVAPVPKALVIITVCLMQSPKLRGQLAGLFGGSRRTTT